MHEKPIFDGLFLGVGAMKAGSTWLYALLERHPDLFFTFEKEIHYFYHCSMDGSVLSEKRRLENARDKYTGINPAANRAAGVRNRLRWAANYLDSPVDDLWYRNLFLFRQEQAYCCDFSNLYALLSERGWQHVAATAGRLRVLYTLRDPVKRLWSHVKFHLQITNQAGRLDDWGPDEFRRFVRRPFIWDNAEYGAALRRMRAVLPADAIKVAFFEDIHADPSSFLRTVESFLGVGHFDFPQSLIARRVNESIARPIPDYFADLFDTEICRIVGELRVEGLVLPAAWSVH